MNVSELVMGPPFACRSDATVPELARKMIEEGVGSLAVVDGERLVGIVTDRDVVQAVAGDGSLRLSVGEIMTGEPDTIDFDADVFDAIDWLNATGYRHLPVTRNGHLVGIVSIKDLLWAVSETRMDEDHA